MTNDSTNGTGITRTEPADPMTGEDNASTEGQSAEASSPELDPEPAQEPAAESALRRPAPRVTTPNVAAYWAARKNYLDSVRKVPELRQQFIRALAFYTLRRALWSFGFFPVFIAFWVPLVMANFNPVIVVGELLPALQEFLSANPEAQANMISRLLTAWLSVGFFFLVFDFVLTPFRSPYQYEADVYMRVWAREHYNHTTESL